MLLSGWALTSCAHVPTPPDGPLYLHFKDKALCSMLGSGETCPALPIGQTEKFYMLDPLTFKKVQNYIDELIQCVETRNCVLNVTREQLDYTKFFLSEIKRKLHAQTKQK